MLPDRGEPRGAAREAQARAAVREDAEVAERGARGAYTHCYVLELSCLGAYSIRCRVPRWSYQIILYLC